MRKLSFLAALLSPLADSTIFADNITKEAKYLPNPKKSKRTKGKRDRSLKIRANRRKAILKRRKEK